MVEVDRNTIIQIFGSLMNNPNLLSDIDKYQIMPTDFSKELDKYVFSAIYNLYIGGAQTIHATDIEMYLKSNEYAYKILTESNGISFLADCENYSDPGNFYYYYNRLKKIALLRELARSGKDISKFYSDDPLDDNHIKINEKFEKLTPTDIVNTLKGEVAILEERYSTNKVVQESNAFSGVKELLEELKIKPEVGVPLQGDIFNSVSRGGRKGKMYLRSAGSGVGKSRSMVGDACNMAYPIRFEPSYNRWVATGHCEKVLYIMTEQDPAEIQTMILAYLTGINEEVFLYGLFEDDQMDRIMKAVDIMEKYKDNMLFAHVPDPCASVIKNLFRRYNLQHEVENFFFDYIFSSPAMLEEYRDLKLPEYVCLRLFTTCLKNLAVELNAFVMTSTQITDDGSDGFKDYHVIQGSKSICNLVDLACIMSRPSPAELEITKDFQRQYSLVPNCITDIFKNRRGRWTMIRIWSRVDLGTCKKYDLFATTPDNKPIEDFQIISFGEEVNRDLKELEDFYNLGVVSEKQAEQLFSRLEEDYDMPPTLMTEMETAFGDKIERRKKLEDVGFEDLV